MNAEPERLTDNLPDRLRTLAPGSQIYFPDHVMSEGFPPRPMIEAGDRVTFAGLVYGNTMAEFEYPSGRREVVWLGFLHRTKAVIWPKAEEKQ